MRFLYILSVYFHILSALVWAGGMLFLSLMVVPVLRESLFEPFRFPFLRRVALRFRVVGWVALFFLVVTGLVQLTFRGGWKALKTGKIFEGSFGALLQWKLSFVALIFVLSLLHDFYVGPKATLYLQNEPASKRALFFRKTASFIGRANLILALFVVLFAVMLVRGMP